MWMFQAVIQQRMGTDRKKPGYLFQRLLKLVAVQNESREYAYFSKEVLLNNPFLKLNNQ